MKNISPITAIILLMALIILTFFGVGIYRSQVYWSKVDRDNIEMSRQLDKITGAIAERKGVTPEQVLGEYSPSAAREYYRGRGTGSIPSPTPTPEQIKDVFLSWPTCFVVPAIVLLVSFLSFRLGQRSITSMFTDDDDLG